MQGDPARERLTLHLTTVRNASEVPTDDGGARSGWPEEPGRPPAAGGPTDGPVDSTTDGTTRAVGTGADEIPATTRPHVRHQREPTRARHTGAHPEDHMSSVRTTHDRIDGETPGPREMRRLRVLHEGIDPEAATKAVSDLLVALGRDPSSEHLAETPRRVAEAFAELLTPEPFDLTTFPNDEHYDELVLVREIPFRSLCEHHLLPFHGLAHVGYLPAQRILGLSKLARVVEHFAADLQTQERLTMQVADWLATRLRPKGVGVVIEADHTCMSLRGVRSSGARTLTSAVHGLLRDDARSRQEFFALTNGYR